MTRTVRRLAFVVSAALAFCAVPHRADADAPGFVVRPAPRFAKRILADLARRDVEFARDGADAPAEGLDSDGRIDGRRRARIVPLALPPVGSADMYTDLAFVDARTHRYWARRTGGFLAVNQWVGPFHLPRVR